MKKVFFFSLALVAAMTASAQRETGYRGFADLGYVLSMSEIDGADISNRLSFTTTHGYQWGSHVFVGAGAGIQYFHQGSAYAIPLYAAARFDLSKTNVCPFVDAKVGYSVGDWQGLYSNLGVGVRFSLNEKLGLNVGVGYLIQTLKDVDGTSGDLTFKVGVDF